MSRYEKARSRATSIMAQDLGRSKFLTKTRQVLMGLSPNREVVTGEDKVDRTDDAIKAVFEQQRQAAACIDSLQQLKEFMGANGAFEEEYKSRNEIAIAYQMGTISKTQIERWHGMRTPRIYSSLLC